MTKKDLIEKLSEKVDGLSFKDAEAIVNTIFQSMTQALASGDRIEIRGFGSFHIRERKARGGRNPKTGEDVLVEAKKAPFFKAGKDLKGRIND